MKNEEWRDVVGYEGLYQLSDQGRVKSLARQNCLGRTVKERILKSRTNRYGYMEVNLCADGKRKMLKVHRLVCQAFHDNPDNKPEVNHVNEDKTDNRACNLEWCTRRENLNHGTRNERSRKSLSKPVGQYTLNGELVKVWPSAIEVQRQTGFSQGYICNTVRGKYKQAYGYIWKYVYRKEETTDENYKWVEYRTNRELARTAVWKAWDRQDNTD